MTEEEWLSARSPRQPLRYLHKTFELSDRKCRLFAVACCRRAQEHFPDVTLGEVIDGCERLADNFSFAQQLRLSQSADRVYEALRDDFVEVDEEHFAYAMAVDQLTGSPLYPMDCADSCMQALCGHDDYNTGQGEVLFQADLLRDVFGNPFRPVVFSPSWRTETATALARQMYDARDFSLMPILADALEDAGCDSADVLCHCRADTTHIRGCWVVDLVLERE